MSEFVTIKVPRENPNDETVKLVEWLVKPSARVEKDDAIATLESSKATYEVVAPSTGFVAFRHIIGAQLAIGEDLAFLLDKPGEAPQTKSSSAKLSGAKIEANISRKAAKLMRDKGVDASVFQGKATVEEADVLSYLAGNGASEQPKKSADQLAYESVKATETQALFSHSQNVIYSRIVTPFSATQVGAALTKVNKRGLMVSMNDLFIHLSAKALLDFPELNSFYKQNAIFYYPNINVGFAANLGKGLKVLNIPQTDKASLEAIAAKTKDLTMAYLREELSVKDMLDGTFTVTDLSGFGVTAFDPVINRDQGAILGICAKQPGGEYFNVVVAFDHRVADGMMAGRFLQRCQELLNEIVET